MKTNLFFYSKVKYFILICIFSIIFNSCTDNIEGGNYYLGKPTGEIEARNSFAQILSKALYDCMMKIYEDLFEMILSRRVVYIYFS